MGFFIRKSKKFGLFNFNLSKSGIGASFGITGIRTGIDSKGRVYISGGKGMFRYRKYLSTKETSTNTISKQSNLNNLYERTGLGMLWWWFQFTMDIAQIILLLCGTGKIVTLYGNTNDDIATVLVLATVILALWLMRQIHKIIFTPRFIKMINYSGKFIKRDDYVSALDYLNKAKITAYNSKLYKITHDFTVLIDNLIKICENKVKEQNT